MYGWNFSQQLAQVLGQLNGQTQAAARNNFAVSAYTLRGTGYTGSNGIELESSQVALAIPAGGTGRFLASSIDVAAANCEVSTAAKPLLNFSLVSPSDDETPLGGTINACSSGTTFPAEARGTVTARSHTAGRYWSTAAFLYSGGSTVGLRVRNVTTFSNGDGNDHAFDNLRLIDASPTLSKSAPALTYVGQPAPITFTVTNTVNDNLAKTGWSFTDSLPAGLLVAQNPNASSTCAAATITAAAGANTISITNGSLAGGPVGGPATTCTITVNVVSNVPGSYSNGADQITSSSGLNLPQAPAVMEWVSNQLTLSKLSNNGTGTFGFSGNNGVANQTITTTTAGTAVSGAPQTLTAASLSANTVITETVPDPTWSIAGVACTGLAAGQSPTISGNQITIPAAGLAPTSGGRNVQCTVINHVSRLTLIKAVNNTGGGTADPVQWTLSATGPAAISGNTGAPAVTNAAVPAGVYTLAESGGPAGYTAHGPWSCGAIPVNNNQITLPVGTSATCSITNDFNAAPAIALAKTATLSTDANSNGLGDPGDVITYSFKVSNTGNVPLTSVTVSDPGLSGLSCSSVSLAVGETATLSCTGNSHTITQQEINNRGNATPADGSWNNTATATGNPPTGNAVTGSSTATVRLATPQPRLTIAKQATPGAFAVGSTGTYSLQVSNAAGGGQSDGSAIVVSDPLPAGITATDVPSGSGWDCSASTSTVVSCTTNAVLTSGASAPVISVPVLIGQNAANPSVNTATVGGGGDAVCTQPPASTVPAQCQAKTETTVNAPRLDLVKTSGGAFTVGQPASYAIVVTNNGQAATSAAATVEDTIPAGLVIGTSMPSACTANGQVVSCTIPAGLAVGGQASFTVTVTPDASLNGQQVTNNANVTGGGDATCPASGTRAAHCDGSTTNTVSAPQLNLTKSATPTSFTVGQEGTYTLTVTNSGTAATNGDTVVSDTIPAGLTIGTLPSSCTANGQQISCTLTQTLDALNGSATISIPVIAQVAVNGQTVQNAATVKGGGDPGCTPSTDPLPARCQAQVPVSVVAPALHVQKTASDTKFSIGVAASYTIQVTNLGTVETDGNWTVTDVVPGGLTIGTLPNACTASGQQVTCTSNTVLVPGDTTGVSFIIPVTPKAAAVPSVTNTATVQGGGDPQCPMANNANCSSTVTTPVDPQADMQATSPQTVATTVGTQASVTTTCTNNGPNDAANATCTVTGIPAGANPVTTCTPPPPVDSLPVGQSISCTTTFTPVDTTPITIITTAGSDTMDPNPDNNTAPATTTAVTPGLVTMKKSLNASTTTPIVGGQAIVYDLVATNSGGTAVQNHEFFESVPANTTYSGSITGATTNCAAGAVAGTLCTVTLANVPANGTASATMTFTALNPMPSGVTSIANLITDNTTTMPSGCSGSLDNQSAPVCPPPPPTCDTDSAAAGHCVQTPVKPLAADMEATSPQTVATTVGTQASVTTTCTNNGPNDAANATCTVTGVPAGANPVTACTPLPPVDSLPVGQSISCTTTFTPVDTNVITITTTAGSDTPDPNASNNTAVTKTQSAAAVGTVDVPANAAWMLALLSMGVLLMGAAAAKSKRYK